MSLSPAQHRFLTLYLHGSPDRFRAAWTVEGRHIAPVEPPYAPPAEAEGVAAWRLSDGGHTFKGAAELRRTLPVSDLAALAPCWAVPFRELSAHGRRIAEAPAPTAPELVARTFKLSAADDRSLSRLAGAQGVAVSDLLRGLVADLLKGSQGV